MLIIHISECLSIGNWQLVQNHYPQVYIRRCIIVSMDETSQEYLRRLIAESGKSIARVARDCDTSPSVIDSVLVGRRNLGIDLATRLARSLDVELISFLVGMRILPETTTNSKAALEYSLARVFDELSAPQKRQLVTIARALAEEESA
jgi:hypothetical protein